MACLTILSLEKDITVEPGTILLDALRQAGIEINAPCNGQGLCGKCEVYTSDADPAPSGGSSPAHGPSPKAPARLRKACEVVVQQDMCVTIPGGYSLDTRIMEGARIEQSGRAPAGRVEKIDHRFNLCYHRLPPEPLQAWQPDYSPKGIAVDLGTTTVVVTLMDLDKGSELATTSSINPQIRFGGDVMTRIHKASTPEGLTELFNCIAKEVNKLIGDGCRISGARRHEIIDAVIGGNTTMLQIAAAIDPLPLGRAPFTVGIQSGRTYPATRFGLHLNPQARVYIPPVAHAFVGSDISAGLLSIGFFDQKAPLLFIDMGTNGEMALIANGEMIVTSTAAGPAFEGMGISCGMRASPGAIEMVQANGRFLNIRTVEDAPARGLCGSGIMDLMACLVGVGAVEPGGRLRNPRQEKLPQNPLSDLFAIVDGTAVIKLTDGVNFTQHDIRQFQLAKSAIQTGMEMLLRASSIAPHNLEKIVIAGAFGYHLNVGSLRKTGIIPGVFKGKIEFAGNTSRTGCALLLMDTAAREFIESRMKRVRYLSVAEEPDFQSRFLANISLNG